MKLRNISIGLLSVVGIACLADMFVSGGIFPDGLLDILLCIVLIYFPVIVSLLLCVYARNPISLVLLVAVSCYYIYELSNWNILKHGIFPLWIRVSPVLLPLWIAALVIEIRRRKKKTEP